LVQPLRINDDGYESPFVSTDPFFHPSRHIPPTNPSDDINISPVEGYLFAVCQSMQNVQWLTNCGGVNKYVCKYIGKIDEQNYVVVFASGATNGKLITKATFLHNTKITSSKINEDKARESKRGSNHPQGRAVSQMEMLHMMLKYPEVYTDLNFVSVPTLPLELRSGVDETSKRDGIQDATQLGPESDNVRRMLLLDEWRQHSENEIYILNDFNRPNVRVNMISIFSCRPPELRNVFNMVGSYFRWFHLLTKKLSSDEMHDMLSDDIQKSIWVDGFKNQVKVKRKALPEIELYLNSLTINDESPDSVSQIYNLFRRIIKVNEEESGSVSSDESSFIQFIDKNLIYEDTEHIHLPVPVYSYPKPTMSVHFLLHILLSLGKFDTEIDLLLQPSLRMSFRYAKLIGPSDDANDLQAYSDALLKLFIKEQIKFYPRSLRVLDDWIITAAELFDNVILHNNIPITEMPAVQFTSIFSNMDESIKNFRNETKNKVIDAAFKELGEAVNRCNIPTKHELISATKEDPLDWDAAALYSHSPNQPRASINEQQFAIQQCKKVIDSYRNIWDQTNLTKSFCFRGFPGSGKTWLLHYCILYSISTGLNVIPTAMMAKRSIQIGGRHWHYLFGLPIGKNLSTHRMAEMSIDNIRRNTVKLNFLLSLDIIFCDEIGQVPAEFLSTIDYIMRRIRNNNIFLGGLMIIATMDHTQIQPINAKPFLTSSHIITCFRMVNLSTSVRSSGDATNQRIQEICRYNHATLQQNPALVNEFLRLVSYNCTFVDSWTHDAITPSTYRLYGKRVPAKEASKNFTDRVRRSVTPDSLRERKAEDVEKSRYSHSEWSNACNQTTSSLEQKLKEPTNLLFFRGALYEFTYNKEGKFSQSDTALLFDLPSQDYINDWKNIPVLLSPPGLSSIEFDESLSKQFYVDQGFKEVYVGIAPQRVQILKNNIQGMRKQYGLKHKVTGTIHSAMGDTLLSMATEISNDDPDFRIWEKGQLVVLLSRTKEARNTIFVGNKNDTLKALKNMLLQKTQWTDYMEQVLDIVTINNSNEVEQQNQTNSFTQNNFPFRICDITLPQCRTGFVYMLISLRMTNYLYIGQTICVRQRIQQHNSGYGATSTKPSYLCPFALLAYICGFGGGKKRLREHIEFMWKAKISHMKQIGIQDISSWAKSGEDVINELTEDQFGIEQSDLKLVCLFRDD
jgi:hypothetical protein